MNKYFATPEDADHGVEVDDYGIPRKLMTAVRKNYDDMKPFRDQVQAGIKQFAGEYGLDTMSISAMVSPEEVSFIPLNKVR